MIFSRGIKNLCLPVNGWLDGVFIVAWTYPLTDIISLSKLTSSSVMMLIFVELSKSPSTEMIVFMVMISSYFNWSRRRSWTFTGSIVLNQLFPGIPMQPSSVHLNPQRWLCWPCDSMYSHVTMTHYLHQLPCTCYGYCHNYVPIMWTIVVRVFYRNVSATLIAERLREWFAAETFFLNSLQLKLQDFNQNHEVTLNFQNESINPECECGVHSGSINSVERKNEK